MKEPNIKSEPYPRLHAYLASLPAGLDSYPEAKTRAFYSIELLKRLDKKEPRSNWPPALHSKCQATWRPDDWIPATIYSALASLARDGLWTSEDVYRRGMAEIANEMYGSLFYRSLMLLLSPTLLVKSAANRWAGFNQGSELLVLGQTRNTAQMRLRYPESLYSDSCLSSLGATVTAALARAKAHNPQFRKTRVAKTETDFHFEWT